VFKDSVLRGYDDISLADGFLIFKRNTCIVPIFKGLEVREHLQTLEDGDTILLRIVNPLTSDKISGTDHPGMGVMSKKKIFFSFFLIFLNISTRPIPVAAQSKTSVCGRTLAGLVGSNTAGDMDVCLL